MASSAIQIMTKRSIKPKAQYSPSNIPTSTKYHLIIYDDTEHMMIVGNSSVKRLENDDTMVLNNGRTAKLIVSGTKDQCIDRWNKQTRSSKNNNNDEYIELGHDDTEDVPDLMQQTLQVPTNTFSTPAPYRRQKTIVRRSVSPDSNFPVPSAKRFAPQDRLNNGLSTSRHSNRVVKVVSPTVSSSEEDEEEEVLGSSNTVSSHRLFKEIRNTQAKIRDTRMENHGIHQELMKLTKKISHFGSLLSTNNDQFLDRYRDLDSTENFKSEIMYVGENLLDISARNVGEYARRLLKMLFTTEELRTSLLPSSQAKRYSKPELNHQRFNLLNEAVRTRYRISKHHYEVFYKDRIQETLSGCLYNEGIRKPKQNEIERQRQQQKQQQQQHNEDDIGQNPSDGD